MFGLVFEHWLRLFFYQISSEDVLEYRFSHYLDNGFDVFLDFLTNANTPSHI